MKSKHEEVLEILNLLENDCDLLSFLTNEQSQYLKKNISILHFQKNQIIYEEGELPTQLMCLARGKVHVFRKTCAGKMQIVRMIKPIEMFAYRAFFAEEKYLTSALASSDSLVCAIPRQIIVDLVRQNNNLAMYFIKLLAVDLGQSDVRSVNLSQKHLRGRLAEALLSLKDHYGYEKNTSVLNISLTRKDLASFSNMTTSNAIRSLSQFSEEKIISIHKRRITILDEKLLFKISQMG